MQHDKNAPPSKRWVFKRKEDIDYRFVRVFYENADYPNKERVRLGDKERGYVYPGGVIKGT